MGNLTVSYWISQRNGNCFDTPNEWKLPHLCERKDAEHESSIFYGVNYDDGNIKYRVCMMGPFY